MPPKFNLDKIKFATDRPTFERAVDLYESGKVTKFKKKLNGYFATVMGTKPYNVYVFKTHFDRGDCECYLGQKEILCKHMVAVAIYACLNGQPLREEDKEIIDSPGCSGALGELNKEELSAVKTEITSAMRYIKGYSGPSRTWFAYQGSLDEGCARLSKIVSGLPISVKTAKLLVDMLLRIDKKLCTGGVDDSNGTVGGFMQETVSVLEEYVKLDSNCIKAFEKLCEQSTCFDWEKPLVEILDEHDIDN